MTAVHAWTLLLWALLPWLLGVAIGVRIAYQAGVDRERLRWLRRVTMAAQNPDRARGMLALLDDAIDVADSGWIARVRGAAQRLKAAGRPDKGLN
ncbi:MAG TPA: hypothetical protein VGO53_16545 [Steroidobacteraceae bacterium]|jgi:hypothetical protein|nr:hypothetical protein [Steroidobacteraceae bacterium]